LPRASGLGLAIERNPTHHQGIVYPAEVFHSSLYSCVFRVMGDYEFNLRLRSRLNAKHSELYLIETNEIFCDFEAYGISGTSRLGNYIESFKCKMTFLGFYLLPIALIVELFAYMRAKVNSSFRNCSWLK